MSPLRVALALALVQAAASSVPAPPTAREIAAGTYLLPGAVPDDRGPDGNTVIYTGPTGLVVVDTGRHVWHSDGILAFARERQQPVVAIINTHWHLDHTSGNRRIKAVFPGAKVYTTRAVDRAIGPAGFLTRNLDAVKAKPLPADAPAVRREETQLFIDTMDHSASLLADVPVDHSEAMTLAGRPLKVNVATDAVSDGDIWIYDEATHVAVIGDIVTFPAPFFESACPAGWQAALDAVWATPFTLAVPGHGTPMSREQFDTYRKAFGHFRTCVDGDTAQATCADGWTRDVASLLTSDADRKQATAYASYYVDFLRKGGGKSADCRAK